MKIVKIILREKSKGIFQIEKFTNTVQLSIGQCVPIDRVEQWVCMPRCQIEIVGRVGKEDQQNLLPENEKANRFDALAELL